MFILNLLSIKLDREAQCIAPLLLKCASTYFYRLIKLCLFTSTLREPQGLSRGNSLSSAQLPHPSANSGTSTFQVTKASRLTLDEKEFDSVPVEFIETFFLKRESMSPSIDEGWGCYNEWFIKGRSPSYQGTGVLQRMIAENIKDKSTRILK